MEGVGVVVSVGWAVTTLSVAALAVRISATRVLRNSVGFGLSVGVGEGVQAPRLKPNPPATRHTLRIENGEPRMDSP